MPENQMESAEKMPAEALVRPAPPVPAWLLAAVLAALAVLLYWPVTRCGFIDFDDPDYVANNHRVLAGLSLENVAWAATTSFAYNWHPITWLSLMLDVNLFGKGAAGFHFTNLVLHAINGALIFLLLWRLTVAYWRSAWVAVFFAVHPLHVESVAWVAERKDVLSAFFGLLTLLLYSQYARSREAREAGKGGLAGFRVFTAAPAYWLACFSFALGLMSKPMLVTWPFVLLLLDYWPLGRFQPGRLKLLVGEKIPFFMLAVAASITTFLVQKSNGAVVAVATMTAGMRIGNALLSYVRYLGKMFWPADLAVYYPYHWRWPVGEVLLAGVLLAGITVLLWTLRRRHPFLLMGWLWYGGTLVPVIGLVQVGGQSMADRYAYIPSVGILIMVAWSIHDLNRHWRGPPVVWPAVSAVVAGVCFLLARRQISYWQDSITLFNHALAVTQNNAEMQFNLGYALVDLGRIPEGISHYHEALRIEPDFAEVHCDLGIALMKIDQTEAAESEFASAIRLQPDYAEAHCNLGILLLKKGQAGAADGEFATAIRLDPNCEAAYMNYGFALASQGQSALAANAYETAIRLDPDVAEVRFNLGNLLARNGQPDGAITNYQAAIRLKPDYAEARNNLGLALAGRGENDAAVGEYEEAIRSQPDFADAHNNLGNLLLKLGRIDEAITAFQSVIRLRPGFAPAHYNLGVAFAREGRADEAITEYQTALRLKPDYAVARNSLGISYGAKGMLNEAISQFQEAVKIKPDYAAARTNLARALELKNKK